MINLDPLPPSVYIVLQHENGCAYGAELHYWLAKQGVAVV
jgi:hypothetical protein